MTPAPEAWYIRGMPWRSMRLRNQKVLARCTEDGELVADGGRVEIRYKPHDGRAYRAAVRNLHAAGDELLPDDHCGPAEVPEAAAAATKDASASKKSGTKKSGTKKSGSAASPPTKPTGNEVLVYADGACSGNPGPAGLGVIRLEGEGRRALSEYLGEGTNNIAELTAILRAAESIEDPAIPLRVYTDSTYSIGVLQKGWKAKANKELVAEARRALARLADVVLIHVKGHAGIELNEVADQLAVAAVESRSTTGWLDV